VLYAESKSDLTKDEVSSIGNHLENCDHCREELQILTDVNKALSTDRKNPRSKTFIHRLKNIIPSFGFKPAFAYIIILLLLYPAWLGIFRQRGSFEPTVANYIFELIPSDTRSEQTEAHIVDISPAADQFSLSVTIPILSDEDIRYDAVILDAENKIIWRKTDIKSLDEYGSFLLICHRRFFKEGIYSMIIEEIDVRRNQKLNEFVFSFKRTGS